MLINQSIKRVDTLTNTGEITINNTVIFLHQKLAVSFFVADLTQTLTIGILRRPGQSSGKKNTSSINDEKENEPLIIEIITLRRHRYLIYSKIFFSK